MQDRPSSHALYHRPAVRPVAALLAAVAGALVVWAVPATAVILVWPILFVVPGWVVVRRVVPDLPMPGAVGAAVVLSVYASAHLVEPRRARRRLRPPGRAHRRRSCCWSRPIVLARLRHRWLAPFARPTRASVADAWRADRPAWLVAAATSLVVLGIFWTNGWVLGPGRLGHRRLELERPARPRRDRLEHRGRQLPARGPVLRRRAADLPLVRRLPRRHRGDRGRRGDHPGLLRDERPVRGRPGPRRLGAGARA